MKRITLGLTLCLILGSCAEMQVKRDLAHVQQSESYALATQSGSAFDPANICSKPPAFKSWVSFKFSADSEVYKLPLTTNAAAHCVEIPDNAKAIEIFGPSAGGMTYHEITVVHPSILFLDKNYQLVDDLQEPKLKAGQGMIRSFGVSAIVTLTSNLQRAKYAVIYVHPLSTGGEIDVYTGYETIPVPYGPYGEVRVRFFN